MKVSHFKYTKKKTGEVKSYDLLVLKETDTHIGGIDYSKLDEDEVREVTMIQMEYEKVLHPFVKKAYKNFIKENVEDDYNDGNA
jgi:hypothetical protein